MAKMYIANCTHQIQDFQYRLPERDKLFKQSITIGGQIEIPGDLSTPEIDSIVEQHAMYGLIEVTAIDRSRDFNGLCYSVDRKINVESVRRALQHNNEVLVERGRRTREEAAVAVNNAVNEQTQGLQAMEMSVEEIARPGHDTEVNETIRVDPKAAPTKGPAKGGRK